MRRQWRNRVGSRVTAGVVAVLSVGVGSGLASSGGASAAPPRPTDAELPVTVVHYDSRDLAEYQQKWSNIYGPLDGAARDVDHGVVHVTDVPFKTGVDFSVYDHLKYMAVSNQTFPAPRSGSIEFAVDIEASTPGAVPGHIVHGQYGPPGSYDPTDSAAVPYRGSVLQGQQAAVVLNMIDFCSGQLFDWFLSSDYAFPLVERLPTTVTGNTSNPNCPDASQVGLDQAYTQIVKEIPIRPGVKHHVAIVYRQRPGHSEVTYLMDGDPVATVDNVGVPLDKQDAPFSGTYPSLGSGEPLAGRIASFSIGHGLFSLLDAFPFQYGCTPPTADGPGTCDPADAPYSVSIPASERAFGQGAAGSFSHFTVRTVGR